MTTKPRKQVLGHSDNRVIIHAALFLVCALLSALGVGALAFWCFIPAAVLFELLAGAASRQDNSRRM
jgi:hypothetical protein